MHRNIEFVTVNQSSINYDGVKIVFHRSVVKAWFVFRNPNCPILKTALHRLQLKIMSGPAGIRLQSVLSGAPLPDTVIHDFDQDCSILYYNNTTVL